MFFHWGSKADALKKSVSIHRNGDYDESKILYVEPGWTIRDLLKTASFRLDMNPAAELVFDKNGVPIDDCLLIEENAMLFFSSGEPFSPPENQSFRNSVRSILPTSVGPYRIKKLLGRGGFGEVRVGVHQLTEERFALKFVRKLDIQDIDALDRTMNEILCLQSLRNQNIISMAEHFQTPEYLVLVFEIMEGGDLGAYMHHRGRTPEERRFSCSDSRLVFTQVLNGVSYAHNQNIIHRDLKLENILLKGPSLSNVKIADFGLSAFFRPGSTFRSNCGTLSYLAPETFGDNPSAGPPLDIWSMGVILFAMLCGRLPFDEYFVGDDQSSKRRRNSASAIQSRIQRGLYKPDVDLSIEAKDLIKRLLAVDPAERCTLPEALSHPWMRMIFSDLPSRGTGDTGAVSEQPLVLQAELVESLSTSAGNRRDSDASSAASRDSSARTSEVNAALVDGGAPAVDGIQGQLKINSVELSATPVLNDPAPKAGMIVLQRLRDPATCTADNDDDDDEAEEAAAARATERIRNVLKSTLDAGTANSTGSGTPQSAGVKPKRGAASTPSQPRIRSSSSRPVSATDGLSDSLANEVAAAAAAGSTSTTPVDSSFQSLESQQYSFVQNTPPNVIHSQSPVIAPLAANSTSVIHRRSVSRQNSGVSNALDQPSDQLQSGIAGLSGSSKAASIPSSGSDKHISTVGLAVVGGNPVSSQPLVSTSLDSASVLPPRSRLAKQPLSRNLSNSHVRDTSFDSVANLQVDGSKGAFTRQISEPKECQSSKGRSADPGTSMRPGGGLRRQTSAPLNARATELSAVQVQVRKELGSNTESGQGTQVSSGIISSSNDASQSGGSNSILDSFLRPFSLSKSAPSGKPHISI